MLLTAFTVFHVLLSLIGIAAGFVVLFGFLTSRKLDGWTLVFLTTTIATSATGFLFPFHHFLPSHAVGILSLFVLGLAVLARYRFHLTGGWLRTYVISSSIALYFNVFVLIAQLFQKVAPLKALAPTQSEPPFQLTQLVVLILFILLTVRATMKFHHQPLRAASAHG